MGFDLDALCLGLWDAFTWVCLVGVGCLLICMFGFLLFDDFDYFCCDITLCYWFLVVFRLLCLIVFELFALVCFAFALNVVAVWLWLRRLGGGLLLWLDLGVGVGSIIMGVCGLGVQ